ncbi:hypothetical protein Cgig2_013807 [Carnegiea gigantea]|uniref:Uncharacterized protein n=1 Tax=Carnegiea gigantea TaxID=171969 RepID=A0A9Q1GMU2_9CARY|nr:hypothetical protein Cgig2_013807 [Carnegiea gigantea]
MRNRGRENAPPLLYGGTQQVMTTKRVNPITIPTIIFDRREGCSFTSPYNGSMVVELKVVNALDYLKKLKHPRTDIVPLVHSILRFGGQEVGPVGVIYLALRFGNKTNFRNLEVDFPVVDIPVAYHVVLGCPTLHKVKAFIAPYLLKIQYEADDGSIGKIFGDR